MAAARYGSTRTLLLFVFVLLLWIFFVDATSNFATGNFTIAFSNDSVPAIKVFNEHKKLVWLSSVNKDHASLVVASRVEYDISQNGGVFNIKTKIVDQCNHGQILTHKVEARNEYQKVVFFGTLCEESSFSLSFQASDVEDPSTIHGTVHQHLLFNLTVAENGKFNHVSLVYGCDRDEGFYGFGFQYSKVNVKGHRLPLFSTEQGVGRGLEPVTAVLDLVSPGAGGTWYTTYSHVPQYVSSSMRSLMLDSLEYTVFDFTKSDVVSVEVNSTQIMGRIFSGSTPLELISSYTSLVGRMPRLPAWTNKGAVLGLEGGTEVVMDKLSKILSFQGSLDDVAGIWLQDWTGQRRFNNSGHDIKRLGLWWNWELDSTLYPHWSEMISNLTSEGVRVLTYINCLLTDVSSRGTPYRRNLFKEALQNGYLVRLTNGKVWEGYTEAGMVDLTNPSAYKWMLDIIQQEMLAINVSGWMADFGESLPLDAKLYSGESPSSTHSRYPQMWAKINKEAIESYHQLRKLANNLWNDSDILFFMRSASPLSTGYSRLFWLGDQLVTWDHYDGLQTAITGMLSGGISGFSIIHSDIGGYTTLDVSVLKYERKKELFMRWVELAAFTPFFRTHPGSLPSVNWQFDSDQETLQHFFKMVKVFKAWGFYRDQLMVEAEEYGWPVVRHLMLVYPNNPKVYKEDLSKQFMIGSELLVAPQYKKSSFYVDVFLPGGVEWVHVWTNFTYLGGNTLISIPAPIGQPCVLYKKGSTVGQQFQENLL